MSTRGGLKPGGSSSARARSGQGDETNAAHNDLLRESARAMIRNRADETAEGVTSEGQTRAARQLAQDTAEMARYDAALPRIERWLSSHPRSDPDYAKNADLRLRVESARGILQERIVANQQALGRAETPPSRTRRDLTDEERAAARAHRLQVKRDSEARRMAKMTPEQYAAHRAARAAQKRADRRSAGIHPRGPSLKSMTPDERRTYYREAQRAKRERDRNKQSERGA